MLTQSPTVDGSATSEAAQKFGVVFLHIFSLYWKDVLLFTGGFVLKVVAAWLVALVLGIVIATVTWNHLRKRGWLSAPWKHYRYFGWLWLPVMVIPFALSFATAGAWWAGGRTCTGAIVSDRVVPRAVVSLYCAVMTCEGGVDLSQVKTPDEIITTLEEGDERFDASLLAAGDFAKDKLREAFEADGALSIRERLSLFMIPSGKLGELVFGEFIDEDPRLVLAFLAAFAAKSETGREFIASSDHADGAAIAAAVSKTIKRIERECAGMVNSFVYTSILVALLTGVTPVLPLVVFRLIVRRTAASASRQPPPVSSC